MVLGSRVNLPCLRVPAIGAGQRVSLDPQFTEYRVRFNLRDLHRPTANQASRSGLCRFAFKRSNPCFQLRDTAGQSYQRAPDRNRFEEFQNV